MKNLVCLAKVLLILCCLAFAPGCAKKELVLMDPAARVESVKSSSTDTIPGMQEEPVVASIPAEDLPGQNDSDGMQVSPLATLYFDFDSWLLTPNAREILVQNAEWLRNNPVAMITLEGHTDERGSDSYNMALGERRAISALQYLLNLGINADRLKTVSFGEEKPAIEGSEESVWSKNRRVEFIVSR